jgi:nitrite reductase (NADH) small subunit
VIVVRFTVSGGHNCVVAGGMPYVYAATELGGFVLPARCRHRGGPLHLARLDLRRARLICPWHQCPTPVGRLPAEGLPAVRRGDVVTAVLPHPSGTPWRTEHRAVSPDLRAE